jgi:hypothetical protein
VGTNGGNFFAPQRWLKKSYTSYPARNYGALPRTKERKQAGACKDIFGKGRNQWCAMKYTFSNQHIFKSSNSF